MGGSRRHLVILIALGLVLGALPVRAAKPSLEELGTQLRDLVRCEMDQRQIVFSMQQELRDAAAERRVPDITKLKHYATATGERTEAYHKEPKYIRDLIDRFEGRWIANISDALKLGVTTMFGGKVALAIKSYQLEIERSERFIKILEGEQEKVAKRIAALQSAEPTAIQQQHARLDAAADAIEKGIVDLDAVGRQFATLQARAQAARDKAAGLYGDARKAEGRLSAREGEVTELTALCTSASDVADQMTVHAANLINNVKGAETGFEKAGALITPCSKKGDVEEGLKFNDAALKMAKDAAATWKKMTEGETLIKDALASADRAKELRSFVDTLHTEAAKFCAEAGEAKREAEQTRGTAVALRESIRARKAALLKQIERIEGGFAADDAFAKRKLDGVRAEIQKVDIGDAPVAQIEFLAAEASGNEGKACAIKGKAQERKADLEKEAAFCEATKVPEGVIDEAARAMSNLGMGDLGKGAREKAKECLARLEQGAPAAPVPAAPAKAGRLAGTGRWNDGSFGGPIDVNISLDSDAGIGSWTAKFSGGGRGVSVAGKASGKFQGNAASGKLTGGISYTINSSSGSIALNGSVSASLTNSQISGKWSSGGDAGSFTATVH